MGRPHHQKKKKYPIFLIFLISTKKINYFIKKNYKLQKVF